MDTRFAMIVEVPGEFDDDDVESGIAFYIREYSNELASRISVTIESANDCTKSDKEWHPDDEKEDDQEEATKVDRESENEDEDEDEDEDDEEDEEYEEDLKSAPNFWKIIVDDARPDETSTIRSLVTEIMNDPQGFGGRVVDEDCEDDEYTEGADEDDTADENE